MNRLKLVKALYFLKVVCKTNIQIDFDLFMYGPFSKLIPLELEKLIHDEKVTKQRDIYSVTQPFEQKLPQREHQLLRSIQIMSTSNVEILSICHMVIKRRIPNHLDYIKSLKPRYTITELKKYEKQLKNRGWIN